MLIKNSVFVTILKSGYQVCAPERISILTSIFQVRKKEFKTVPSNYSHDSLLLV